MNITVGSAILLMELAESLKSKHTATWEKIKAELCATDAEFEVAFGEILGKHRQLKRPEPRRAKGEVIDCPFYRGPDGA